MTPKEREVMQMALDALEQVQEADTAGATPKMVMEARKLYEPTITALRAALAQPKQEPVAWMYDWYDETEDIDGVPIGGIVSDCISKDYDEAHSPTMGCHNIRPLYTAPPQREWQGLTDEQIREFEIWLDDEEEKRGWNPPADIVKYIEAKLREKNSG